jgi:hypothetical protein
LQLRKHQRPRGAEARSHSSIERKRRRLRPIVTQYLGTNQPLKSKRMARSQIRRFKLRVERNTDRKEHLSRKRLMSK